MSEEKQLTNEQKLEYILQSRLDHLRKTLKEIDADLMYKFRSEIDEVHIMNYVLTLIRDKQTLNSVYKNVKWWEGRED